MPGTDEDLNKWLVAESPPNAQPGWSRIRPPDGTNVRARCLPFYAAIESLAYRMYFDNDRQPFVIW